MKAIFGWRAVLTWIFIYIIVEGLYSYKQTFDVRSSLEIAGTLVFLLVTCLQWTVITPQRIKIFVPLNPFIKKVDIDLNSISSVLIKSSKFAGITTIMIQTKDDVLIEKDTQYPRFEEKKLLKVLQSHGIEADIWPAVNF